MGRSHFNYSIFFFCGASVTLFLFVKQIFVFDSSNNHNDYTKRSYDYTKKSYDYTKRSYEKSDEYLINSLNEYSMPSSNIKCEPYRPYKKSKDETLQSLMHGTQHDPNLIEQIRSEIKPPSGLPYNLSSPKTDDYSQFKQGEYLYEYFKNNKKFGTFIEAGAFDGEVLSNTLILEKKLNWTGLLIEPNPISYKSIPDKNRKAHHINCCISVTSRASKLKMSINGLISEVIDSKTNPLNFKMKKPDGYFSANCYPLYSLMVAANLTTLDLLSLDLEGVEFKVLESIPWEEVDIKSVIIEIDHIPEGKHFLWEFMEKKNYRLQNIFPIDYFFVKNYE